MLRTLKWIYDLGYKNGFDKGYKLAKDQQAENEVRRKIKKEML